MGAADDDGQYDEIKRCLACADSAFALAGAADDDTERLRLIEEAENWLVMAERSLARVTGRAMGQARSPRVEPEGRSFRTERSPSDPTGLRRMPRA